MALNSKKEFATKCGKKSNWLSNYITRKQVEVNDQGYIDDAVEKNAAFLKIWQSKLAPAEESTETSTDNTNNTVKTTTNNNKKGDQPELFEQEKEKGNLENDKKKLEIEKLSIQNAKLKGEVIPTALVKSTFIQHNKSIVSSFHTAANTLLSELAVIYNIDRNEIAKHRGRLVEIVNASSSAALTESKAQVDNIVKEYSEKKGAGEKND